MKLFKKRFLKAITFAFLAIMATLKPAIAEDSSPFKLESSSTALLTGTTLTLVVEEGVLATTSEVGDSFVARVLDSAYTDGQNEAPKNLLIPKGSWITGRVVAVQNPARLSKAGKLSLELDSLTTLTGEFFPLNATLSFETGKVNQEGMLDPQTGFKVKALEPTRRLLGSNTGQIVSIATLGLPVVATLIGGSAKAIVSKGDNIGLMPGESFQIELKDSNVSIKE